jgi:hypothetical protein
MKIRLIGKTSSTVGHSVLQVRGISGKKYPFKKVSGEGYIYSTNENKEIEDIFNAQNEFYSYFFTPVVEDGVSKEKPTIETEGKSLDELRDLCYSLNIPTIKQDKERSLTRMLEAYKLGCS